MLPINLIQQLQQQQLQNTQNIFNLQVNQPNQQAQQQNAFVKSFFQANPTDRPNVQFTANTDSNAFNSNFEQFQFSQNENNSSSLGGEKKSSTVTSMYDVFSSPNEGRESKRLEIPDIDPLECVVTVFGFPPELSSTLLGLFRQFGNIVSFDYAGNSNFMHIQFESPSQARQAVRQNGCCLDEGIMIGVIQANKLRGMPQSSERKSSSGTPLSSIITPMKVSAKKSVGSLYNSSSGKKMQSSPASSTFPTPSKRPMDDISMTSATPMSVQKNFNSNSLDMNYSPAFPNRYNVGDDFFNSSPNRIRYPSLQQDDIYFQPKKAVPLPSSRINEESVSEAKEQSLVSKVYEAVFNWG